MKKMIGVRFKRPGKIYFFDPGKLRAEKGDFVIVETSQGEEYGEVVISNREIEEEKLVAPLKKVIRIATQKDRRQNEENKKKEEEAKKICIQKNTIVPSIYIVLKILSYFLIFPHISYSINIFYITWFSWCIFQLFSQSFYCNC